MKQLAVLASGEGTNLEAILDAVERDEVAGRVTLVISDRGSAPALARAKKRNIKAVHLDPEEYKTRQDFDQKLIELINAEQIDLVILAGFMRMLSAGFIKEFPQRIINIHPSLLPAFPGLDGIEQAFKYGVKVTGCTVHFVDEGLDSGPVILQEAVPVIQQETVATLEQRIHAAEHRIYPIAIDLFCRGKLKVVGRRCMIVDS